MGADVDSWMRMYGCGCGYMGADVDSWMWMWMYGCGCMEADAWMHANEGIRIQRRGPHISITIYSASWLKIYGLMV